MVVCDYECQTCKKKFTKRTTLKRSKNVRFCSNDCKHAGRRKPESYVELKCFTCKKKFKRYKYNTAFDPDKSFCSRSCQMIETKRSMGQTAMTLKTFVCEGCGAKFQKNVGKKTYRFCSKRCSNVTLVGGGYEVFLKRWTEQFGEATALQMLKEHKLKRSRASTKCNTGRHLSEETKKKISSSVRECYASGKSRPPSTKHRPTYRGIKLHSLLELAAVSLLERRDGLVLGETLLYEDSSVKVDWIDSLGDRHTYFPDFYDVVNKIVYEVKPSKGVVKENVQLKASAARAQLSLLNIDYHFITELDVQREYSELLREFSEKSAA